MVRKIPTPLGYVAEAFFLFLTLGGSFFFMSRADAKQSMCRALDVVWCDLSIQTHLFLGALEKGGVSRRWAKLNDL